MPDLSPVLFSVAIAFGVAVVLATRLSRWRHFLDVPGHRSLHEIPVPRTGGLAIAAGIVSGTGVALASGAVSDAPWLVVIGMSWLLVLIVSFLDDARDVPAPFRLLVHLLAAGVVVALTDADRSAFVLIVAVLFIAWTTNLFNFMDGMDGLAGAMAVVGSAALVVIAMTGGDTSYAIAGTMVVGSVAGFLLLNLPPARIFMGDTGSAGLGFLLAAFAWVGYVRGLFSWQTPLIVFMPFILDATLTLMHRIMRRVCVWEAHREHAYQRLVLSGLRPARVLFAESVIMLVCAFLAIAAHKYSVSGQVLLVVALLLSFFYWRICANSRSA